jgi:CRISPR type III-B/RAMP module RAMP protein Cmr6
MTAFALKLAAVDSTQSWHLALDKFPFNLQRKDAPSLSFDERGREHNIKPQRLPQIVKCYKAAKPDHDAAIKSRRTFLETLANQHGDCFRRVSLVNSSRLLLHLGRASVLENVGLYADRTTGLPLIPGSAVKGIVSTWACWEVHFNPGDGSFREMIPKSTQRCEFTKDENKLARTILGDNSTSGSELAGLVTFLGAYPVSCPMLSLDIVTPHAGNKPSPNPFLAIEPGTKWDFILLVHPSIQAQATLLLDTASRWLTEALCLDGIGLGSKTASGYGRFVSPAKWVEDTRVPIPAQLNTEYAAIRQAAAQLLAIDYANTATFKNRVLSRLNPARLSELKPEIEILKKPENAIHLAEVKAALTGQQGKELRKAIKDKHSAWFPQEWLPTP